MNDMRYTYLGDKLTAEHLRSLQCDPVKNARDKCIISHGKALVVDAEGNQYIVIRRRLRLNQK